jgi:hypothetical protein
LTSIIGTGVYVVCVNVATFIPVNYRLIACATLALTVQVKLSLWAAARIDEKAAAAKAFQRAVNVKHTPLRDL